jgi:hypothetical protein
METQLLQYEIKQYENALDRGSVCLNKRHRRALIPTYLRKRLRL